MSDNNIKNKCYNKYGGIKMRTNFELKEAAKLSVKPYLFESILAVFLVGLILGATSYAAGASLIIGGPIYVGLIMFFSKLRQKERPEITTIFQGFKEHFTSSLVGYLLSTLFIMLWSLLLIIPGLIKSFSYSMTLYIIKDNPTMSGNDAITLSRKMMDGNKMRLLSLYFSYIGWFLLGIITFGIALIYIAPFVSAAVLEFYEDLKANQ
jgi:uncharacterized membrane protein